MPCPRGHPFEVARTISFPGFVSQEYDGFTPSADVDLSKLILAVSPSDHDVFNPRCPSGYAGYNVQIHR